MGRWKSSEARGLSFFFAAKEHIQRYLKTGEIAELQCAKDYLVTGTKFARRDVNPIVASALFNGAAIVEYLLNPVQNVLPSKWFKIAANLKDKSGSSTLNAIYADKNLETLKLK